MLSKLAGIVLVGSLATLTVGGLAGAHESGHSHWRVERHVKRQIDHNIEHNVKRHVERRINRGEDLGAHRSGSPVGTYVFDADGNALGKFPWSANVQLELRDDGRYELRVKTSMDGEVETETSWGKYELRGNVLRLHSPGDDEVHELMIEGDRLQLNTGLKEKLAMKAVGISDAEFRKQSH